MRIRRLPVAIGLLGALMTPTSAEAHQGTGFTLHLIFNLRFDGGPSGLGVPVVGALPDGVPDGSWSGSAQVILTGAWEAAFPDSSWDGPTVVWQGACGGGGYWDGSWAALKFSAEVLGCGFWEILPEPFSVPPGIGIEWPMVGGTSAGGATTILFAGIDDASPPWNAHRMACPDLVMVPDATDPETVNILPSSVRRAILLPPLPWIPACYGEAV
jgi:hypothetical protein